jgi:hypothetical protein
MIVAHSVVVVAQRNVDREVTPGARDRDVEESSLLFEPLG